MSTVSHSGEEASGGRHTPLQLPEAVFKSERSHLVYAAIRCSQVFAVKVVFVSVNVVLIREIKKTFKF